MKEKKLVTFLALASSLYGITGMVHAATAGRIVTIDEAVQIAIRDNPMIHQAKHNKEGAVYKSKSVKADFLPKLYADYSYTYLADDPYVILGGELKAQIASSNQYHWGLTVVQPLFTGYALSAKYDISKLNIEVEEKEKQQAVMDVSKGVKSAYYQLLLTQKMDIVSGETVASLQSHLNDAQRFFDRGIIRLNDLLRSKVALAEAIQYKEKISATVQAAKSNLNRWLVRDINQHIEIMDITTIPDVEYDLGQLLGQGLVNRPLLQVMRLAGDILEKTVVLEKSSYFPGIVFTGGYQQDGDNLAATENDFGNDHNAFLSVKLNWTLFDWNQKGANVNTARARVRAHQADIKNVEDAVRIEIKNSYLRLQVARKNIETSKKSLALANENLRITNLGYMQQVATSTEVLDTRTDLTKAKTNYYQSLYGYLQAIAGIERAIGGLLQERLVPDG